ncbi:MAG TPA: UvrD-helicase domain-containing protein [Holophagaceae bacterium]
MSLPALDLRDPALAAAVADRSLVVSASAGSGKTFALVTLVLGFLGRGGRAPDVVATTFGREAAADLRGRLLLPLDQLAAWTEADWAGALAALAAGFGAWDAWLEDRTPPVRAEIAGAARSWLAGPAPDWTASPVRARAHWVRVRREAELLQAATVHALALSVLRRRGHREGELLEAEDPRLLGLLRSAGRELLDLPSSDPDAPAARRLWAWCEGFEEGRDRWSALAGAFDAHLDALGGWRTSVDAAPFRDAFVAEGRRVLAAYGPYAAEPAAAAALTKAGRPHANFLKLGLPKLQAEPGGDGEALLEAMERLASRFLKADGGFPNYYAEAFQAALAPLEEELPAALEGWMTLLLERVFQRFRNLKAVQGLQSYGDLVREALGLLRDHPDPAPPALLLVDEYQDVNPVQEAFLEALGAARTVVVGDPKQAIYGFRGGVPELLQARLRAAAERGGAFRLPANHRSAAPVVELANAFVRDVVPVLDAASADPDGTQAHGGRGEGEVRVALAALPSAKARGGDLPAAAPWIAALARESGWDATGFAPLPGPRRRALLLPRRTGLPALRQALQRARVEPLVQGREGFWESPGVRLMMTLLEAAGRAEAEAPRLALLRSPWVGATDAELAAFARGGEVAAAGRIREGLAWLEGLRGLCTQALVAAALARPGLLELLAATAVHGALEPARARRNLDRFLGWVPALPPVPALAWATLRRQRATDDPGDAPAEDVAADLVVQTLHASKGLEYDDVILPLMADAVKSVRKGTVRRRGGSPELWMGWKLGPATGPVLQGVKAEEDRRAFREGLNLLYVGLTRARDRVLLLQQWPEKEGVAGAPPTGAARLAERKSVQWHHVASDLAAACADLRPVAGPAPAVAPPSMAAAPPLEPPPPMVIHAPPPGREVAESGERARRGVQIHALLREVLVRAAVDPAAARAHLAAHPLVRAWPEAGRMAAGLLEDLAARGWDRLPRRTEFELAGAGKAGGVGRADLVLWRPDRQAPEALILVDFKLAAAFPEEVLALHQAQLAGYREALGELHPGVPVEAWLLGLEGRAWVRAF